MYLFFDIFIYMKRKKKKALSFEDIKIFLTKSYPQILLILVLLLVCVLSISKGKYLLSNDNYSPELNPSLSISRYIQSPAWRGYRVLGFVSESEQADVFRSATFLLFNTFVPSWLLGQLFYLSCMSIGSLSIAFFTKGILKDSKLKRYSNWGFLVSGIIYFTTLWTMWLFYQSMAPYIANFAFLPLVLLFVYKYCRKSNMRNLLYLFLSLIFFTSTSVIATLFVVDFLLFVVFTIFVNLTVRKSRKRKKDDILKTLGLILVSQLFWILPFIHYTFTTSSDIVDSYTNRTITSSVIDLETEMQTLINSARFYNRTLYEQNEGKYIFPMTEFYDTYDFYKVLGLFPVIFSILGIVFGLFKKNYKILFWIVLGLGSLFLIKVLNPPFAILFEMMQKYIPLFRQVFRWPISKVGQTYLISLTILSTFGIVYLVDYFVFFISKRSFKRFFKLTIFVSLCIFPLIYSEYMFRGEIFSERSLVDLPEQYNELSQYLVENDSTSRIYYMPLSNNNYFREYEWGFWGSQFISYIIPNPVMDMSLTIGSKVGEKALLKIQNVVRSGNDEEFLSLLYEYDVKYILFDRSIKTEGYSFDINLEKTESILSNYEIIWASDFLSLLRVPTAQERMYSESLSPILGQNTFVKDLPRYPTLSPLDMDINNLKIVNNELVGEFLYRGFSTYMGSNLTKEVLSNLPSKIEYGNGNVMIYPSYPYVYGDRSVRPFLSYSGSYDYYVAGKNVFPKSTLVEGITIENEFKSKPMVYGIAQEDFKEINMIPLLLKGEGSDCSGEKVVENTFVTPLQKSSGFRIKGTTESPCVYTNIPIDTTERNIVKVNINWETEENSIPGYCIFSEKKQKCLNREEFFTSDNLYGEVEILLDTVIEKGEKISLILYTTNLSKDLPSESLFRSVTVFHTPVKRELEKTSSSNIWIPNDIFLDDREVYQIRIPIVIGEKGYLYNGMKEKDAVWQPNRSDSQTRVFEVKGNEGMYHMVEDDYINQIASLFVTEPLSKYLLYWRGTNISNVPSSLCLIYDKEEKCWYQDMLLSDYTSSYMNLINSDSEPKLMSVIYGSTSHTLTTQNILKEFVFMQIPSSWKSLSYKQQTNNKYVEYEMKSIYNNANSTYYRIKKRDISQENEYVLITIPQAKSSGWVAISRRGILFTVLGKDTRVSINDWKQGWDVSNTRFDSIVVIYWPNILSYLGYILILSCFGYLIVKLVKEKRNGKK
jgi:hypothetical protein